MSAISTIRHDDIFKAHKNDHGITLIGVGATGSRIFAALVELGLQNITCIDPDVVEGHNLANQIYEHAHIGVSKVSACESWYLNKTGASTLPDGMDFIQGRVPDDTGACDIAGTVFLLTDSMASRKEIFETCLKDNINIPRVIETRMASTHGNVFMFNPNIPSEYNAWLDTLSDDETTEVSSCGSSISVGTTASIIANLAVWQFIHAKTNPEAADSVVNVFLKPLAISTGVLARAKAA